MRALTLDELEFVSGGSDVVENVTVTAKRRPPDPNIPSLSIHGWTETVTMPTKSTNTLYLEADWADVIDKNATAMSLWLEIRLALFGVKRDDIAVHGDVNATVTNIWKNGDFIYTATDDRTNGAGFESLTRYNTKTGRKETFGSGDWYTDPN